jgi:hypothetical protein
MKVESNSSLNFVYSFIFDQETFEKRTDAIDKKTQKSGNNNHNIWIPQKFSEDEILSQVASYLNPSSEKHPTARLWKLNDVFDHKFGLGNRAKWLLAPKGKSEIEFAFGSVGKGNWTIQLVLFRVGVGLLTINARPKSSEVDTWLDFIHYFRYTQRSSVGIRAQRKVDKDKFEPFFPDEAGGLSKHSDGCGVLYDIISGILDSICIDNEKQWWSEVFIRKQLIPFSVIFIDKIKKDNIPLLLYQVRRIFHSHQKLYPTPQDLSLEHPDLLQYAKDQWFVFSLDGGAFVACNLPKDPFFNETLPQHLRSQYFLIFLFSLFQRFELMNISNMVTDHWIDAYDKTRLIYFKKIRDSLLDFTARGYFSQIMQRETHHLCYQKWQEKFQLERLYNEVSMEVHEMHNHLQTVQSKHLENQMNGLTVLVSIATLIVSFLGLRLIGFNWPGGISLWTAVIILLLLAIPLGIILYWRLKR